MAARSSGAAAAASPWPLFFAVAMDSFSAGIMLGSGSVASLGLALLLGLAQTTGDLPEEFVTIAGFKQAARRGGGCCSRPASVRAGVSRRRDRGTSPLRGAPEIVLLSLLAFTAGVLLTVERLVPQAHEQEDARSATVLHWGVRAVGVPVHLRRLSHPARPPGLPIRSVTPPRCGAPARTGWWRG